MIRRIKRLFKKRDEPADLEISWLNFFRKTAFLLAFFYFSYHAEELLEFMHAVFGDGRKYLPANESRKEFRMIITSIICFLGAIPTAFVLYKLVFKRDKK